MQTKNDFPNFKVRGRVTENRMDMELERRGDIFIGRDEKNIIQNKREAQQQEMKDALQMQIAEKNRKKEIEKQKRAMEEERED